jgi:hypothetical protein
MRRGIEIAQGPGGEATKREAFFRYVGTSFGCDVVENWMNNEPATPGKKR